MLLIYHKQRLTKLVCISSFLGYKIISTILHCQLNNLNIPLTYISPDCVIKGSCSDLAKQKKHKKKTPPVIVIDIESALSAQFIVQIIYSCIMNDIQCSIII